MHVLAQRGPGHGPAWQVSGLSGQPDRPAGLGSPGEESLTEVASREFKLSNKEPTVELIIITDFHAGNVYKQTHACSIALKI